MTEPENKDKPVAQADNHSVAVGSINIGGDVSGTITIGNTGYTAEEVSVLITQITATFQPKPFDGRCPYKGLDVFEEEDAELFFGREKLVDDLVSRVKDSRTVFVTGPSGSGKSSLVRAGLIHALKQGSINNSERWLYATMKPGRDPIGELGRVASSLAGSTNAEDEIRAKALVDATIFARWCEIALKEGRDKRAVLFIDQFEEVFTQINNESERVAFLNLLTHAATVENGRVITLFSMRSDFVSNCATYPQLNDLLNKQFIQVGAMQPEELVSAIAQPALRVGLRIDPDLIAQIINEMKGEPGALPLMQFALKDLFDSQGEKSGVIALTLNDYLQRGGIHKALERHADDSFSKLSKNEQELARSIFSGLIEIRRGTQDTRRTALFDELVPASANAVDVEAVVQKLADARLITTDEQAGKDTVTISHEKLIDAWPWLKKLVNENRDVIFLQNEIASDAKEWDGHKRDTSYLYSGARLDFAQEELNAQKITLNELSKDFIDEGINARDVARRSKELLRKRITLGLISGMAIALVLAGFAIYQMLQAQNQAKISRVGELLAQSVSLRDRNFQPSLLLGVEAYRSSATIQSQGALLDNIQAHPQLRAFLNGHAGQITSVAFSPDNKTLASSSSPDNAIILWDVSTGKTIGQILTVPTNSVSSMAFSPDGKTLASGSWDSTVILWDVATRQMIGQPLAGHSDMVNSVAFSPDGKTLASGSFDNTIILWDVATRQIIGQPLVGHNTWLVNSVAFSPDGKTLASGNSDSTIILWDVLTGKMIGQPLTEHTNSVLSVVFSPDGKTLASGSYDNTIILWDVATHQPIGLPLTGYASSAYNSVAFSPDGKILASGSDDKTIILWDIATRQMIGQPLTGHAASVSSVAFSPDGKMLASGSWDKTIILWDMATGKSIGQSLTGHTNGVRSVAFSPNGKMLASGSQDKTIILWDVSTHQPIGQPLTRHTDAVMSVAFSPDGKTLASGSRDKTIILWDVSTRQMVGQPLTGHASSVESVVFSPDGKTLASGSEDHTVILWDVSTRQMIGQPLTRHISEIRSLAFSPDGKMLASGSWDGTIILWDVATRQMIGQPLMGHTDFVYSVAFSPDGKALASGSQDKTIILWDVATRQPIGQPFTGHTRFVASMAFSPDGKILASGSGDGTIILWDVATRQMIGQPLTGYTHSVVFSPDGKTLASGSVDGTIILWDLKPQSWIEKSCQRVGRNFTHAEWEKYFPNEEYRKTCEQFPLEPETTLTPIATP